MSMVLVLVLATGAAPAPAGSANGANATNGAQVSPAAPAVDPASRSPEQLREAVTTALRRASAAKRADREAAVKSLADLYKELGRDVRLAPPERLRLGSLVRGRLSKYSVQINNEIARMQGQIVPLPRQTSGGQAAAENLNDLVDLIQQTIGRPDDWILAQRAGNGGPGAGAGGGPGGAGAGGARGNGGAAGGTDPADANGEDLVDLIQRTVAPPSWDVNGGPGTIKYYRNLRALVVRQTGDVHDEMSDLIDQMRQ